MKIENQPTESGQGWRKRLFTIIFESDTFAGKLFDVVLLVLILVSMLVVIFQSIPSVEARFKDMLYYA